MGVTIAGGEGEAWRQGEWRAGEVSKVERGM